MVAWGNHNGYLNPLRKGFLVTVIMVLRTIITKHYCFAIMKWSNLVLLRSTTGYGKHCLLGCAAALSNALITYVFA